MLLLLLKTSIAVLIFSIGMTATTEDIVFLRRRPVLLVKSITAMYIVMPAVAVLMAWVFVLPQNTELALVILAICAGAPLLPKKLIKFGGDPAYVFSLIVTTSLLAIVTVPISLYLLSNTISFDTQVVPPSQVAQTIFKTFLLPLGNCDRPSVRWPRSVRPNLACDCLCIATHRLGPAYRGQCTRAECPCFGGCVSFGFGGGFDSLRAMDNETLWAGLNRRNVGSQCRFCRFLLLISI